jgi:hypothetical protein
VITSAETAADQSKDAAAANRTTRNFNFETETWRKVNLLFYIGFCGDGPSPADFGQKQKSPEAGASRRRWRLKLLVTVDYN